LPASYPVQVICRIIYQQCFESCCEACPVMCTVQQCVELLSRAKKPVLWCVQFSSVWNCYLVLRSLSCGVYSSAVCGVAISC